LGNSIVNSLLKELRKIFYRKNYQTKIRRKIYSLPESKFKEIQLLHLANKNKKDTEVDHEIDDYLPAINNVLEGLSKKRVD